MLEQIVLHNFCGFRDFTLELDEYTLLIGPNNGGKTTILRAVKFCLDACHKIFFQNNRPYLKRFKQDPASEQLQTVANAGGFSDSSALHFGRDPMEPVSVLLRLGGPSTLYLQVDCPPNTSTVQAHIELDGTPHTGFQNGLLREFVERFSRLKAEFVPPPATITPVEQVMHWDQVQSQVALGKFAETWRNRLHWMNEGEGAETFQRVINRVRTYLGDVEIRPPRRGKHQPQVEIMYIEDGVEHDIFAAGGGVRTLLTLAAAVELSDAAILLFDEPDSHLHSTIQRQVAGFLQESSTLNKQIIVTSHAPDFIEETAVNSIVWVDRKKPGGLKCDEIGKALIDLGAVSHTQALASIGADAIVYVEGKPDKRAFSAIMKSCGKDGLLNRIRLETLKGYGNADKLPGVLDVVRKLRNLKLSITVLLDADYTQTHPTGSSKINGKVLEIRLPGKELENLLLLSPKSISVAVQRVAERRLQYIENVNTPSEAEIRERIIQISRDDDLRETVQPQWMWCWVEREDGKLNDPGQIAQAQSEFLNRWKDDEWRIRSCPGKEILKQLRQWLQADYGITLSLQLMFECYEPSDEVRNLINALEKHIEGERND